MLSTAGIKQNSLGWKDGHEWWLHKILEAVTDVTWNKKKTIEKSLTGYSITWADWTDLSQQHPAWWILNFDDYANVLHLIQTFIKESTCFECILYLTTDITVSTVTAYHMVGWFSVLRKRTTAFSTQECRKLFLQQQKWKQKFILLTRLHTGRVWSNNRQRQEFFTTFKTISLAHLASYSVGNEESFSGVKWLQHEYLHSPPSRAMAKTECSLTSILPCYHGFLLKLRARTKFTFTCNAIAQWEQFLPQW